MGSGLFFITCCFIISIILVIKCRIPIFSAHTFLLLFCALYTVMPFLASLGIYPRTVWLSSLSQRKDLLNIHLVVVGLCLVSFSISYVKTIGKTFRYKANGPNIIVKQKKPNPSEYIVLIFIAI